MGIEPTRDGFSAPHRIWSPFINSSKVIKSTNYKIFIVNISWDNSFLWTFGNYGKKSDKKVKIRRYFYNVVPKWSPSTPNMKWF